MKSATARRDALGYAAGAIIGTGALGRALLAIRAGGSAAGWAFQLQDPRTVLILLLLTTAYHAEPSAGVRAARDGDRGTPERQLRNRRARCFCRDALCRALPRRCAGDGSPSAACGIGCRVRGFGAWACSSVRRGRVHSRLARQAPEARPVDGQAAAHPCNSHGPDGCGLSLVACGGWAVACRCRSASFATLAVDLHAGRRGSNAAQGQADRLCSNARRHCGCSNRGDVHARPDNRIIAWCRWCRALDDRGGAPWK